MPKQLVQEYKVVPVDSLNTLTPNPRKGDLGVIGESIEANGFYSACVVQKSTNTIVAGNHRYLAAIEQGLTEVPCIYLDIDDDQARRIAIADNRTADIGSYDNHILTELLKGLENPTQGTGYDDADIQKLIEIDLKTHILPETPAPPVIASDGTYEVNGKTAQIRFGDNTQILAELPEASIDSIVTDPPYELDFMGNGWDDSGIAYSVDFWSACFRVLKPGGYLLAFGIPRNYHRMAVAIDDAGFEIRDSIHWIFGSGFPKSLNVSNAVDNMASAVRGDRVSKKIPAGDTYGVEHHVLATGTAVTPAAEHYNGYGTALKPAHEPVVLARKPFIGTVTANVLEHGTGALNIDAARVGTQVMHLTESDGTFKSSNDSMAGHNTGRRPAGTKIGRIPPNLVFSHTPDCEEIECVDDCPVTELDEQSDRASRFFPVFRYQAKAPKSEKPRDEEGKTHATVKPLQLMRWLVKLATPENGIVLDPFAGSGTTLEAALLENFNTIGIEQDPKYLNLIKTRLSKHTTEV